MAAEARTGSGGKGILVLLALGAGILWLLGAGAGLEQAAMTSAPAAVAPAATRVLTIPNVGDVTLREHAVTRHGAEAEDVRAHLSTGEPPHRWKCPNGKEYVYKYRGDGTVSLMVVQGCVERTAFQASANYLAEVLLDEHCQECNAYHDCCNGPIPAVAW